MMGLAHAQAVHDTMEPPSFSPAEDDRVSALVLKGFAALRETVKDTIGDVLDDVWGDDDDERIRYAVTEIVRDNALEALQ